MSATNSHSLGIEISRQQGDDAVATLEENKTVWDGKYNWPEQGDEWSAPWGGPEMQWYGSILPRIFSMVNRGKILEIACGYGRWTQFLQHLGTGLVVVDLSEECIAACRTRFHDSNIEYHVNDGTSLKMIASKSIDFIFSYDSLVHADATVIEKYLSQFGRILTDDGMAFVHHSNLGAYRAERAAMQKTPEDERANIEAGRLDADVHWRDPSVSAELVEKLATKYKLQCISQEVINWGTIAQIDCYSTIVPIRSRRSRDNLIVRNHDHSQEIERLKKLSQIYSINNGAL